MMLALDLLDTFTAKLTHMQSKFIAQSSPMPSHLAISKLSEAKIFPRANGLSQVVSPAKIFPSLVKALGFRVSDLASGSSTPELLANYDRDTRSWKTLELSLFEGSIPYSGTLPKSGTMRNGRIYAPPMSERPTEGKGSGLWATPAAADAVGSHGGGQGRSLRTDIYNWKRNLWPTPTGHDGRDSASPSAIRRHSPGLGVVAQMFPTPTKADGERSSLQYPGNHNPTLLGAVKQDQLPGNGSLNPVFVEWLMGYPLGWTDLNVSEIALSLKLQK
jgi:hypothetical protein